MVEGQGAPQDYSKLYVSTDFEERVIRGVVFKFKHLTGPEVMRIAEGSATGKGPAATPDRVSYMKKLFKASCVSPLDIDLEKLAPGSMVELLLAMEEVQGLGERVLKNFEERLNAGSTST